MKTFNLIEYIIDFPYKKYFLEQLDLIFHPGKHFQKIIIFIKDNILQETKTFKVVSSTLHEYIQEQEIVVRARQETVYVSISNASTRLNLINDSQREILKAA